METCYVFTRSTTSQAYLLSDIKRDSRYGVNKAVKNIENTDIYRPLQAKSINAYEEIDLFSLNYILHNIFQIGYCTNINGI